MQVGGDFSKLVEGQIISPKDYVKLNKHPFQVMVARIKDHRKMLLEPKKQVETNSKVQWILNGSEKT